METGEGFEETGVEGEAEEGGDQRCEGGFEDGGGVGIGVEEVDEKLGSWSVTFWLSAC